MKVGIMSMQRIINYGSYLQAYALSSIIKNLGHDVEFVDFKIEPCIVEPFKIKTANDFSGIEKEYFYKLQDFKNNFKNKYLKELGVNHRNESPNLDTLVIGSDEVFNCLQKNPDVGYSLELFGKNNKANKLITYAASCGATTYEGIKKYNKEQEISELLKKFDAISVRDENSNRFVKSLSNIDPLNHLDPVLIYDFSNVKKYNVNIDNYIILYGYSFNFTEEEEFYIKEFAKKHNKKIVSLGSWQRCTDIYIEAHPFEVLPYFEKADFVITNTFHGTIFSIKSHTPFATSIKDYNPQKLEDLLNRLNVSDRKINSYSELINLYSKPIDFSKCDEIIENEKIKTIDYLTKNI